MKHLISPMDLTPEELSELLSLAQDIMKDPERYRKV